MTTEEQNLTEAQRILDGSRCRCGEYGSATINYEPGCMWIRCDWCRRVVSLPDYNVPECLILWNQNK